jgi:hypothetical protein
MATVADVVRTRDPGLVRGDRGRFAAVLADLERLGTEGR